MKNEQNTGQHRMKC